MKTKILKKIIFLCLTAPLGAVIFCACNAFSNNMHEHDYSPTVVPPTCVEQGYTEYICGCGYKYKDQFVPANGHNYTANKKEPNCTEVGYTEYVCACGDKYRADEIPAKGHSYTAHTVAPTCTEDGYTEYACACGDKYRADELPAKGHSYTARTVAPTCTEDGYTEYVCACGDSYIGDRVNASGHDEVIDKGYAATCTATGMTDGSHCKTCGKTLVLQEVIPMQEHSFSAWTVIIEPDCENDGLEERKCSECGKSETRNKSKTGHSPQEVKGYAPTCTESGLTDGEVCSVCGEVLKEREIIPADGHKEIADGDIAPDCHSSGKRGGKHCGVCGEILVPQTDYGTPTGNHSFVNGACTVCGATELSCEELEGGGLTVVGTVADTVAGKLIIPAYYGGKRIISVADGAFSGREDIEEIWFSSEIENIGKAAFVGCLSVSKISSDAANGRYFSQNNCLIERTGGKLVLGCKDSVIPDGVKSIAPYAFTAVGELSFPDSLIEICDYAFDENALGKVTLNDGVEKIGESAFRQATSVYVPTSVKELGDWAFGEAEIYYAGTEEQWAEIIKNEDCYSSAKVFFNA